MPDRGGSTDKDEAVSVINIHHALRVTGVSILGQNARHTDKLRSVRLQNKNDDADVNQ